jgi:proteasome lid subunit RPN8/RPN11
VVLALSIPSAIYERIVTLAKEALPLEACGIIAGRDSKVEEFYEMTNTDESATHYMMDPAEQFKVVKKIRAAGTELLAVYHSHPETPARLSEEDIRLALTPGATFVVLSLQHEDGPVMKGFVVEDGQSNEIGIEIVKG